MTDEANIAEAELAKVIGAYLDATRLGKLSTSGLARALLAAGYRKRSDVLEEAAKVCDELLGVKTPAYQTQYARGQLDGCNETCKALSAEIRSLKGQP